MSGKHKTDVTTKEHLRRAIALSALFAPIGLLYASVVGGIILTVTSIFLTVFVPLLGVLVVVVVIWPLSVLWAIIATSLHNSRVDQSNAVFLQQQSELAYLRNEVERLRAPEPETSLMSGPDQNGSPAAARIEIPSEPLPSLRERAESIRKRSLAHGRGKGDPRDRIVDQ